MQRPLWLSVLPLQLPPQSRPCQAVQGSSSLQLHGPLKALALLPLLLLLPLQRRPGVQYPQCVHQICLRLSPKAAELPIATVCVQRNPARERRFASHFVAWLEPRFVRVQRHTLRGTRYTAYFSMPSGPYIPLALRRQGTDVDTSAPHPCKIMHPLWAPAGAIPIVVGSRQ